jgi:argininosuccinate lyase
MEDSGRLPKPLDWRAQAIVFGESAASAIDGELRFLVEIDRAHLVMLVERQLLPQSSARRLLKTIETLVAQDFEPLRHRRAPRGSYLLYEHWLIETLGESIGGAVHLARSRNDIAATTLCLRLRPAYARLVRELLRLLAVLIRRGHHSVTLTMPIHAHYQAAVPVTYGHYLAGVALALSRDLQGIEDACRDLDRCPLGADAAGDTTVSIDTERTARLLGFRDGVQHATDAVASRDLVLRLLAATTVLGVTLSQLAADLLLWSTAEVGLVRFPDELVGSSSMLPRKRNPFLLEHIQERASTPLGVFTAATTAMHAKPFSNSVAVGTSGGLPLLTALRDITDATLLARVMVAGIRPQRECMNQLAADGFTSATELANRLVREAGFSFRQAHRRIGELVTLAARSGDALENVAADFFVSLGLSTDVARTDPGAIAARPAYGGGAAAASLTPVLTDLRRAWSAAARRLADRVRHWREAQRDLALVVETLLAERVAAAADVIVHRV